LGFIPSPKWRDYVSAVRSTIAWDGSIRRLPFFFTTPTCYLLNNLVSLSAASRRGVWRQCLFSFVSNFYLLSFLFGSPFLFCLVFIVFFNSRRMEENPISSQANLNRPKCPDTQ
jgi:hypothetical protein